MMFRFAKTILRLARPERPPWETRRARWARVRATVGEFLWATFEYGHAAAQLDDEQIALVTCNIDGCVVCRMRLACREMYLLVLEAAPRFDEVFSDREVIVTKPRAAPPPSHHETN